MDKAVQLALMTKAKKVFGNKQTFLSFPVTPLGFKKEQLGFRSDPTLQNIQAFTKLVNQLPEDEAWIQTDPTYLWEVYEEVLQDAELADSSRSSSEEAEYQQTRQFLGMDDPASGGTAVVKLYEQYSDALFTAQEAYTTAKTTAESSTNQNEREQWANVREPALRKEIAAIELDWVTKGNKNEVEAAKNKLAQLGAKSPHVTWGEWQSKFNRDIDTLTNATDLSSVYPTSFNPADALEFWQPFTLSGDEVKQFVKEAPAELRDKLADSSGETAFESLTFEFSSVTLERPWFVKEVFKSRFWRFPDKTKFVSSGGLPATGLCPAYVTAVIFVRHVLGKPAQTQSTPGTAQPVPVGSLKFPVATLRPEAMLKPINLTATLASSINMQAARNVSTLKPLPEKAETAPRVSAVAPQINLALRSTNIRNLPSPSPTTSAKQAQLQRLKVAEFTRLNPKQSSTPSGAVEPPKPTQQPPDDTIYILAFICKTVARCPHPDPNMQW